MSDQLVQLDHRLWFPDPQAALDEPEGLLAIGGDLRPERLLLAYQMGIFPWFEADQPILWWSPPERAVVEADTFKASKSLERILRKNDFSVALDLHFDEVIMLCQRSRTSQRQGTRITDDMIEAYTLLFEADKAHCIACFENTELVGGLYGVSLDGIFCGESMFSLVSNASKVAFAYLARLCQDLGVGIIDCQMPNPHLMRLGAKPIPRSAFQTMLREPHRAKPWSSLKGWLPSWQTSHPWTAQ